MPFSHLRLVKVDQGAARLTGGGYQSPKTQANKNNREGHGFALMGSAESVTAGWEVRRAQREAQDLPVLPKGIPLLLEIDSGLDVEAMRDLFDFEVVAEQDNGFVIVAAEDIQLSAFIQKAQEFVGAVHGSGRVASVHRLHDDPSLQTRLERLLSAGLFAEWGNLAEDQDYVVDCGIAGLGTLKLPNPLKRRKRESDHDFSRRMAAWSQKKNAVYERWDSLQTARLEEVREFVRGYDGEIHEIVDGKHTETRLADSVTVRTKIIGRGLRDFVLNYPYLFEVVEPDDLETPQQVRRDQEALEAAVEMHPPGDDAPTVCVIDSGMQEKHTLLAAGIDTANSHCFLPGAGVGDVADYVSPGGHGTRVAGAVMHGDNVPNHGEVELEYWVQNARVLDNQCKLPEVLFPAAVLKRVIEHYHLAGRETRIFNHSINATAPCRTRHMSAWAAEIDALSNMYDILVIQSAGNLQESNASGNPGVQEHVEAGRAYPDYLNEASCRVSNPGQSLQALTVGSIAYEGFRDADWSSFAPAASHPSAFSRSGYGIWDAIKPEVVEYGGDLLLNAGGPARVGTPSRADSCYPNLVRSTLHGGPAVARDAVGTSFAAPKVARIAARLEQVLPDESCLLYRALIVQSARWPKWALDAGRDEQENVIRRMGYGLPNMDRATTNDDYRVTLITDGEKGIGAGDCHIYQVPIPQSVRPPADDYDILIEVTLSYTAEPRRTRRSSKRYLSVWLDWKSSQLGESMQSFREAAMNIERGDHYRREGRRVPWMIGTQPNHGVVSGPKRDAGTVQKDWATVKSNRLPDDFCVAVRGHKGWSIDPDATATYSLAVSFEIIGRELPIYEHVRVAVEELGASVAVELPEAEAEMQVD